MSISSRSCEQSNGLATRALGLVDELKAVVREQLDRIQDLERENTLLREQLKEHKEATSTLR